MSEKFVIAVVGRPDAGKSSAIIELTKRFPFYRKPDIVFPKNLDEQISDVVQVGEYKCEKSNRIIKIGICSFGDNNDFLSDYYLPLLSDWKCAIVVVACHNRWRVESNTYEYVAKKAKENGYKFLTTSIIRYEPEFNIGENGDENNSNSIMSLLNEVFAENMINLIKRLSQ